MALADGHKTHAEKVDNIKGVVLTVCSGAAASLYKVKKKKKKEKQANKQTSKQAIKQSINQ